LLNKAINISIYNVFNPANKNISGQYDHEGHRLAEAGGTFSWFFDGCERCRGIFAEYWLNRRPCCLNGTGEDEKRRSEYVRGDRKSFLSPIERCEWRNAKVDARTVPRLRRKDNSVERSVNACGETKRQINCFLFASHTQCRFGGNTVSLGLPASAGTFQPAVQPVEDVVSGGCDPRCIYHCQCAPYLCL
jgi:hypothetical protein